MKLYKTINVLDTSEVTLYDLYYIHISKGVTKCDDIIDDGIYFVICTYVWEDYITFTPFAKQGELFPPTKRKPFKITSENVQCVIEFNALSSSSGYDDCGRWVLQLREAIEMHDS